MDNYTNKKTTYPPSGTGSIYYRLIALWVLCEAMLGGIIHGLKIPVSGLIVGSAAVICICLIAWYVPARGAVLKATLIVAIFKMMLSPQAPPPAYIAVFFQGLMGEVLFFRNRRFYHLSCIILALLALLESGLQRILVLTIVYGNDLWTVINDFINGLTKQKATTNYSLLIAGGYLLLHFFTGLLVGSWAMMLPHRITQWQQNKELLWTADDKAATGDKSPHLGGAAKKRKRLKKGLFIIWLLLIALYIQSYFKLGTPLLPSHVALKIFLRSLIIVLSWIFIVSPLLKQLLHHWLQKKQTRSQQDVREVLNLLPGTQQLIVQSWKHSSPYKGWKRISITCKMILANALRSSSVSGIYILTAPVRSGKTTSLVSWSEKRNDVHGILTPVVDGKRVFMDAHTRRLFLMEAKEGETEVFAVGKFVFSKTNFEKAIQIIRNAIHKDGWLVIDEIGPLELRGEGFHDVLKEVLSQRPERILLMVREGLAERVKEHFNIPAAVIVNNIGQVK